MEAPETETSTMDDTLQSMSTEDHSPAWYAVHVKRYQEHRVTRHLATRPIATLLPLIESVRQRTTMRGLTRLEPLFPGYVFVQMPPLEADPSRWHHVQWTPGVRRILGIEGSPVPVPGRAIEAIQARIHELGFVRPGVRFSTGARVRIRSGPLEGLEGVFDRPMSRAGRVRVLLELLGQTRYAELDELNLESA